VILEARLQCVVLYSKDESLMSLLNSAIYSESLSMAEFSTIDTHHGLAKLEPHLSHT
jgi:hypothetical protein